MKCGLGLLVATAFTLAMGIASPAAAAPVDFTFQTVTTTGKSVSGQISYDTTKAPSHTGTQDGFDDANYNGLQFSVNYGGMLFNTATATADVLDRDAAHFGDQVLFEVRPLDAQYDGFQLLFQDYSGLSLTSASLPTTEQLQLSTIALFEFVDSRDDVLDSGRLLLTSNLLPAVPEASTWAMMTVGMGVVGGILRRRKRNMRVSFA